MKYKIQKELATKWVAALRSGEYKQIYGAYVGAANCACALGVGHLIGGATKIDLHMQPCVFMLEDFNMEIPTNGALYNAIVELNDTQRLTFPEIADWINMNCEFID